MEFAFDARTEDLRESLFDFIGSHVLPGRAGLSRAARPARGQVGLGLGTGDRAAPRRGARPRPVNLFLPGTHGAGLTNLQYAPFAEISGRSAHLAPAALNCAAPDTGNMEVLSLFGSEQQRKEWLEPWLERRVRSSFAMSEHDVASSDATNIATRIERDGDENAVNAASGGSPAR